jgi:hypothetical protein
MTAARRRCEELALLQGVTIRREVTGSIYELEVYAPVGFRYIDAHCICEAERHANWREAEPHLYDALLLRLQEGLMKCEDPQCDICVEEYRQ